MTQSERELGRRWFETVWNQKNRDAIAEMFAPDAVLHEAGEDSTGPEGFYPFFDNMHAMFSDFQVTIEDSIADGDKLCLRWSCKAKHTGPGMGLEPTGIMIHVTGLSLLRVGHGMILEGWQNWDMLGMMEQIQTSGKSSATYIGAS
jgi:predicted ester cyclase